MQQFEPTWESLRQYECPDWFRDAKFGIWAHWGPQSVPMYGDWYARNMYIEGHDQYRYHWRVYGHPSKFGYRDIVQLWKAEKFDPEALVDFYVNSGARYFVAQAAHHDNFDNWDSKHHRWNAVQMGPKKDIVGLWREAARSRGLPFGLTEHMGATFHWFHSSRGSDSTGPYAGVPYDGTDPAFEDLYPPSQVDLFEHTEEGPVLNHWYTDDPRWHEIWFSRIKDVIDQHQPDLLYSDGGVPFGQVGLRIIAHLYNTSVGLNEGKNMAVYTQKDADPDVFPVGVLDIERGMQAEATDYVWQTDTCLGGWFYNVRQICKTPGHVIGMLVDIVSKNGNLLLNVPQRPDGTLDEECRWIVQSIGTWLKVNGEGIYGTRPWQVADEGPSSPESGKFKEEPVDWTAEDFRFTAKGEGLYAFQMAWPDDGRAVIRSLGTSAGLFAGEIGKVELLGHDAPLEWTRSGDALAVTLPAERPCDHVHALKVQP
ncbi:MAG: alpha-L-fucosidase [Planctomycetota bacterium]|jgi:alpha-L-fucosidase